MPSSHRKPLVSRKERWRSGDFLTDFPFLFKVIELRLSLFGCDKEVRKEYSQLWFGREEKLAALSNKLKEKEGEKYIEKIGSRKCIPRAIANKLVTIYTSSLRQDFLKLNELSKGKLDSKALLKELMDWVCDLEDAVLVPYLLSAIENSSLKLELGTEKTLVRFLAYYHHKFIYWAKLFESNGRAGYQRVRGAYISKVQTIVNAFDEPGKKWVIIRESLLSAGKEISISFLHPLHVLTNIAGIGLLLWALFKSDPSLLEWRIIGSVSVALFLGGRLAWWSHHHFSKKHLISFFKDFQHFSDLQLLTNLFLQELLDSASASESPTIGHYSYQPADLPILRSVLSGYSVSPAVVPDKKKEKRKTRAGEGLLTSSELSPTPASTLTQVTEEEKGIIVDKERNVDYVLLTNPNHRYIKLDGKKLAGFLKSTDLLRLVDKTITTVKHNRKVDKFLGERVRRERTLYGQECTYKLRLRGEKYRLAIRLRPVEAHEKSLGVTGDEVLSPTGYPYHS